jgi:hypothetical protein
VVNVLGIDAGATNKRRTTQLWRMAGDLHAELGPT